MQAPIAQQVAALADKVDKLLPISRQARTVTAPEGGVDAAIRAAVREEVRASALAALADHLAETEATCTRRPIGINSEDAARRRPASARAARGS